MPLYPLQIQLGLPWNPNWASVVGRWWLIIQTMMQL